MMKMGGETIQNNLIVFLIGASFSFEVIHPAQKIRHSSPISSTLVAESNEAEAEEN
jgi:uncharacterized protein YcsI (UPF0317 family)